ncbi:thiamine phosphate synthase [Bacteroides sp. 519]|uniref:thiamine phosphate synthase n=1 Tax=Bacteroides sp. 519 TaxID=2302937 RepID=UPI0013D4E434|nr:thiamine phosphate synthase [Bacteroides sp. 519]NDV59886.1 thiamine phosphate synthase [Bacteroides sp. 519]
MPYREDSQMKLIVITPEKELYNEAAIINLLFKEGLETLHLRKPYSTQQQLAAILEEIKPEYRTRIMLHDHFSLAGEYTIKGVHLNRRNPEPPQKESLTISKSFHSLSELTDTDNWEYGFLSPIFDSISKTGYNKAFTNSELIAARDKGIINHRIYALGGISIDKIPLVAGYGFGGVAVLGSLWGNFHLDGDIDALLTRFYRLQNKL